MTETDTPRPSYYRPPARTARQLYMLCYLLLGGVLIYVLMDRYMKPLVFYENIGVDLARVQLVQQQIDPNTAHWSELARLPDIGEVLAKPIVAYRQEQQSVSRTNSNTSAVIFASPEDLKPIKGIGAKTLAGMEPYMKFPTSEHRADR